ncbi:MAG: ABC transporter ATP-binding protein [Calditrichaeota bacterium]|nr:ABC transporter ATP-binding protein [Calditrichota bacterium]
MSDIAIRVEGLGKMYRIGGKQERYRTLRDTLSDAFAAPFRRVSSLLRGQAYGAANLNETIWALKDVSFEVKHGEVVGIIGRNGAGKSTLLKILSRITEPTEGYAEIRGRVGSLLEVGTGFHPELTGRENIYLNGAILGMKKAEIERKFDEIVDFAEIEKFIDTPVKHYSSGMYVRLAFAVAAHLEPEILLVDEVLAVGDAAFQKKCLGKMGDVAREGRTVLFVSHNMAAVLNLCSRAVLLDAGQVIHSGSVIEVVDQYLMADWQDNVFSPRERQGDQRAMIENFEVRPNPPRTGMPVEFAFHISRSPSARGDLFAEVAIAILTHQGVPLFQLYSRHMGQEFAIRNGNTQIVARLDSLPLAPGRYRVNLWLGAGHVPIDWLRDCFVLAVESGHFTESEFVESTGYPVLVPSLWQRL